MKVQRLSVLSLLGLVVLSGCVTGGDGHELVSEFFYSEVIQPDESGKKWDVSVPLDDELSFALRAEAKPFGDAVIRYSDESTDRIVYRYADYLYVEEIRVSPYKQTLFVKVSGLVPRFSGNWECSRVTIYDLVNRKWLKTIELKESNGDAGKSNQATPNDASDGGEPQTKETARDTEPIPVKYASETEISLILESRNKAINCHNMKVRLINPTSSYITFTGYSASQPWHMIQKWRMGNWADRPVGWFCGTGLGMCLIPPGQSSVISVHMKDKVFPIRVGVEYVHEKKIQEQQVVWSARIDKD